MSNNDDKPTSAQVVLFPDFDGQAVMEELKQAGFEVGPLYANSFSITAERKKFETYFNTSLRLAGDEGMARGAEEDSIRSELPLHSIPAGKRGHIKAIVFSKPPDFGPGGNY